jgi:hypothetical protein
MLNQKRRAKSDWGQRRAIWVSLVYQDCVCGRKRTWPHDWTAGAALSSTGPQDGCRRVCEARQSRFGDCGRKALLPCWLSPKLRARIIPRCRCNDRRGRGAKLSPDMRWPAGVYVEPRRASTCTKGIIMRSDVTASSGGFAIQMLPLEWCSTSVPAIASHSTRGDIWNSEAPRFLVFWGLSSRLFVPRRNSPHIIICGDCPSMSERVRTYGFRWMKIPGAAGDLE